MIVSIQAVAAELRQLQQAAQNGELEAEEYILQEECQKASENLKTAYEELAANLLNLPPYEQLVAPPQGNDA